MPRPLSLSLQAHVVDWQRLAWPVPWAQVFGREAPLALEIGFGNGAFLAEQAERHPGRDHVGIELSWTAATHLFRRLHRARLSNVRVLLGDAEALVAHLFAAGSLAEVFVNHPCPWPKARHARRRLLARGFLELLAERMEPGARLTVITDHAGYAAWLAEELLSQRALASLHPGVEAPALERSPTKYQLKALARGMPIHYFEWQKRAGAPLARASEPSAPARTRSKGERADASMPTLTLAGPFDADRLLAGFRPRTFRERAEGVEVTVKLEAVYRRTDAPVWLPVWLIEVLVQEDHLCQQFGIDVVARSAEELLIKLSDLGLPHPTHGVKRALWFVGETLRAEEPALVVRSENLGRAAGKPPGETPARAE